MVRSTSFRLASSESGQGQSAAEKTLDLNIVMVTGATRGDSSLVTVANSSSSSLWFVADAKIELNFEMLQRWNFWYYGLSVVLNCSGHRFVSLEHVSATYGTPICILFDDFLNTSVTSLNNFCSLCL
ncbi:hypothetical protein NPIL_210861 [Nephila pilipes]|uniref:Uncharacterized protein n=1 Tax=Nephila pilipes TaxID=299642 RepID=A0A8X6MSD9_NEPPI|nr:hypothetical protein NPIL_210861 [Nephila pilipes]